MFKQRKRGQAAMEFLMTYGWAILAAIIVVGVLWYLIGNPANLVGNKFQISSPLVSNAMSIDAAADTIQLEFRNGAGESINVTKVKIVAASGFSCHTGVETLVAVEFLQGELDSITANCDNDLVSGTQINNDVSVYYTVSGGTVEQQATGTVSGRVP